MKTLITLFAWLWTLNCVAQVLQPEVLTSGSATQELHTGYLSWNIGDWITETYVGTTTLEQGFLHAFDISKEITTNVQYEVLPEVSVWPNPTKSYFQVHVEGLLTEEVHLVDNYGRVIGIWKVTDQHQRFDISQFPSGQYYVLVRGRDAIHSSEIISITH